MSVKVDFSVYKNIPSAFVTEDYTISHDLKDNNFVGVINDAIFMLYCPYVSMFVLEDEQILCLFRVCRGNLCNYFEYILIPANTSSAKRHMLK